MTKRIIHAGVVLLCAALAGCSGLGPTRFRTYIVDASAASDVKYRGLHLRTGQIIVGDSGDADTLLMSLLAEDYSPFVHAGVVVIENHRPYVYDGYVTVSMFLKAVSNRPVGGGIRRATLEEFIRSQRVVAIYEPPAGVDRMRVARFAQARRTDGTPFDVHFDWRDHTGLYCTEFVAMALQAGGADSPRLVRIRRNPSLRVALSWLQVDADEIVTTQSLTQSAQRVALLSRRDSLAQLNAYFTAKQELHARFTDDQKLGNVWRWTWRGLALQPNVAAFLEASRSRPDNSSNRLSAEFFGDTAAESQTNVASKEALRPSVSTH